MKKTIKNSLKILGCILLLVSCDDYLDVQPEDQYLEETVFAKETSVQNVINGVYIDMASSSTYGGNLTMSTVDVLAQRYTASDRSPYFDLANYNYRQNGVKATFDNIWTNMYVIILNINKTIENLDKNEANIPLDRLSVLKGEILGLRAMLHFDLLRLFGPVYAVNSGGESIPYYDSVSTDINPLLPASTVIEMVLADLEESLILLNEDPVRTYGKIDVSEDEDETDFDGAPFYRYRNLRFNYFSAKALQARVHLYAGNNSEANSVAKEVIDEGMQWFDWVTEGAISATNSDRVFSSEVIFAVQNPNLHTTHDLLFGVDLEDDDILASDSERLEDIFDGNLNEYRYGPSWKDDPKPEREFKTFVKFKGSNGRTDNFQYMQPLIRMSEMYYIVVETDTDVVIATDYLNAVREHRGLADLDSGLIDLPLELMKEYKREFFGEGQLFYYYKRKNMSAIEDGSRASGTIDMNASTYVVPLPESETDYR